MESKRYQKKRTEEHITLVSEPSSGYFGHYSVHSGSAEEICKGIFKYFRNKDINLDNLVAVGCDGTAVNTGEKGGVLRLLEVKLNKPVQHIVCQLHANELSLRHLIQKLDGKTSGPSGFTGSIGRQLIKCESLPIIEFEKIDAEDITVDCKDLSTDQMYLIDIHQAI